MTETLDEVQHPLLREALRMQKIEPGIEVTSVADIPNVVRGHTQLGGQPPSALDRRTGVSTIGTSGRRPVSICRVFGDTSRRSCRARIRRSGRAGRCSEGEPDRAFVLRGGDVTGTSLRAHVPRLPRVNEHGM